MRTARADEPAPAAGISFGKQIAPILLKNCQACHGARDPKGGFQMTTFALLSKAGDSGSAPVTAGKPDDSELLSLISSDDADSRMPKDGDPLPPADVALVKQWIAEGAKFDGPDQQAPLVSYAARPPHPDPPAVYPRPLPVTALAFSPDGRELAVAGYHEVLVHDAASGAIVRRLKGLPQRIYGLSYSPDGSLLAVAGGLPAESGEVKLIKPANGSLVKDLAWLPDVAFRAVFNPAGTKLAACAADRSIRIFDVASLNQERLIEDHADWVVAVAFSPDGTRLASASRDKTCKLFNAQTGESLATYSGHGEAVYGVGFSADGKRVLSCGGDRKIHAWVPEDSAKKAEAGGFGREVLAMTVFQDKLFVCSADPAVRQHKGDGVQHVRNYDGASDAVYALAYHDGTKRLAASGFAGTVHVWNAEDGASVAKFPAVPTK